FADGITEDLTIDVSRIAGAVVIARNSAFAYKGQGVDPKKIGRELGVRYVLQGSVRRAGSQIRINAVLIDAETDTQIWAERFDRDIGDLFVVQNEITARIARALQSQLAIAESRRTVAHPDALDYILRGRAQLTQPRSGLRPYRLVQIPHRLGRRRHPQFRAGDPPQPARAGHRALVWPARCRSPAAIASRRRDRLAGKSAQRERAPAVCACLACRGLRPQRRR